MGAGRRLGLFGGSFNPVHRGHLALARAARLALGLDEVWFIPCAGSADGKDLAPAALRLRWLRKALRGERGLRVSDVEIRRGGISRTVDTLRQLRRRLGRRVGFTVLLGQDQAQRLPWWKEAGRLPALCSLAVFARPGFPRRLPRGFDAAFVPAPLLRVSSTRVRAALRKRGWDGRWLPESLKGDADLGRVFGAPGGG